MKKYFVLSLALIGLTFTSCRDYLTEIEPDTTLLKDFYSGTEVCIQNVNGCYVPLMWEYGSTYNCEWFIGDIASDDALKGGGSTSDMADAYDFENWRTTSQNGILKDLYTIQYQGIGRVNLALKNITPLEKLDEKWTSALKNRLLGELYFLRAFYYFRLVRVFGGTPLITDVVDSEDKWGQPRASVDEVFNQILDDLQKAQKMLPPKNDTVFYTKKDQGRATKGAAQAMLLKTNLYMASPYWQSKGVKKAPADCYKDAKAWGDSIIDSHVYDLCPKFGDNFTLEGENGIESVFEIQYAAVTWGDYGNGSHFGFTAGSFTQQLVRSRSGAIGAGWGFNHPTQNLYDEFEEGDIRRDEAILTPKEEMMENKAEEYYLGNKYLNNKTGMYRDKVGGGYGNVLPHATRGALNSRQIRYADVLLMYAEACLGDKEDDPTANEYIKMVRHRVGLDTIAPVEVGSYPIVVNGVTIAHPTTKQALRHERRMELAMEGHRWFDLVRWYGNGQLKSHMDAYKATETPEAQSHIQEFVSGKHEIFPIPQTEIQLNPTHMDQNPGY